MEELTIEQKAQRYDEALKRGKEINKEHSKNGFKPSDDVLYIFPELKESEDEKIRKAIGYAIGQSTHSDSTLINGVSSEEALAWLKKQGEQKLAWSEDDVAMLDSVIAFVEHSAFTTIGKGKNNVIAWLKSLKDRVQPKQEWSQNDIDMIDWLIRCCEKEHEELCNDKYGHQDIVSDLKRDCRKKWDWLESLKYRVAPQKQWKPSEEQIKVCKEVYADILSAKGFDLGTINSELNRLEEQLKKHYL